MAVTDYTELQLEEAKAYLRDRLRNQKSMSMRVEALLTLYAEYLLNALSSSIGGNVENDVELLVEDLIEQIWDDCVLLAQDEHDRKDMILAYISRDIAGDNLNGRVTSRVRTFAAEITAVYGAGRLLDYSYQKMLSSIKDNLKDPWHNPIITEAKEKADNGEITIPDGLDLEEPHFGQGSPISSLLALDFICETAIADGWMEWLYLDKKDNGAKGYFVLRGSSYPCEECQSHVGIFWPIDNKDHYPPFHRSCVCYVVFSDVERL